MLAHPELELTFAERERLESLMRRRAGGEPFAYLVGQRGFFGRDFMVDPRVLVPRPETEHLVAAALALPLGERPRLLDLCTGSGAVAITLALEHPGAAVTASDLSLDALSVARANALRLRAGIDLVAADLTSAFALARFDAVLANPPYVGLAEAPSLPRDVRDFEPELALFAGEDGLAVIDRLLCAAAADLRPGAWLLLEVGHGQAAAVAERAVACGLQPIATRLDDAGIARVVVLKRSPASEPA